MVDIGNQQFQIDFRGNIIHFWLIERGIHRHIGTASFQVTKDMAQFHGGISYRSPKTVLRLAHAAEEMFREQHPKTRIVGQGLWFRPKKPPIAKQHHEIARLAAAQKKREQLRRRIA